MWPDVLLHAVPVPHGVAEDPLLIAALAGGASGAGILGGILLASRIQQGSAARLGAGFAAGALLFLLFDLLKEAGGLGQGLLSDPLLLLGLAAAFAAGVVLAPASARGGAAVALAWAWVAGISLHSAGEGWIVGTDALSPDVAAPTQVASFLLHKLAEGFTIVFVAGALLPRGTAWGMAAVVGLAAVAGALAGAATGPGNAPLLLFAAGAGAAAWAVLRIARGAEPDVRVASAAAAGALFVWAAGILHEF